MTYISLSLLFSSTGQSSKRREDEPSVPTYITISPCKDGTTAKTKCLNPQYSLIVSPLTPLKRKLKASSSNISAILPKFRVRGAPHHCPPSSLYSNTSLNSSSSLGRSSVYNCKQYKTISNLMSFYLGISTLPTEVVSIILYFLDYMSIQKLSRTCSRLYAVCHNDDLWRKLLYNDFGSKPPSLSPTKQQINSTALVLRNNKKPMRKTNSRTVLLSSSYLKLYQNHMKLGRRWLAGKASTRFLQGHQDSVYCTVWISKDILVSGSRDKTLKVWDVNTGQCIRTIADEHDGSILCMRVNKEKSFLLTGSSDATCKVWSLPNLVPVTRLRGHGNSVLDVCFVNNHIVTSSRDHSLRVWHMTSGLELQQMRGHTASINAIEPVGDTQIVSASGDGTLKLWDIETGKCLKTMGHNNLGLACVRYSGNYLYSGGLEGKIRVWNIETGECINTLFGHVSMIRSIDYFEV